MQHSLRNYFFGIAEIAENTVAIRGPQIAASAIIPPLYIRGENIIAECGRRLLPQLRLPA
jgi:hypothetical protein